MVCGLGIDFKGLGFEDGRFKGPEVRRGFRVKGFRVHALGF